MVSWVVILSFILYLGLLFGLAHFTELKSSRGRSLVNNPYVYALSLAIYCTAWTFFGSVGKAASSGIDFLPIYLGPTIVAVVWWFVLRKIILISKSQRVTSIADFISSRYGKSVTLGAIVTIVAVVAVIPYISIQLKAISICYQVLTEGVSGGEFMVPSYRDLPFYRDTAFYITVVMAIFTVLFGARKLDPNERHEGLVAAVAFESLLKLVAFLAVGAFVTFGVFNGFGDVFDVSEGQKNAELIRPILSLEGQSFDGWSWFWLMFLSMSAVLFLPRQFHISVVENTNPDFVGKAAWVFPLYLLLINIFVLPIAAGGLKLFGTSLDSDTFVFSIPMALGNNGLALFVAIGGFAAATSMVIVAVIALSIMVSNNLVLPLLLRSETLKNPKGIELSSRLIGIRRFSIVAVLLIAFVYFEFVAMDYTLVSTGLISFAGVAQFAPAMLGGIFWKRATRQGAIWGLVAGTLVWLFCLPLPTLSEVGILPVGFVEEGLFGVSALRPYALFGLEGMDKVAHGAFWSMFFNVLVYVAVSVNSKLTPLEATQADLFVDFYKYSKGGSEYDVSRREAKMTDIRMLMIRFLGEKRAKALLSDFAKAKKMNLKHTEIASEEIIKLAETHLSGAIGGASTKVIINSFVKEDPISLEEIFKVLDRTQEIIKYSQELEQTTDQLRRANEQLQELDRMKAEFITTVTHELRTPITSVKALAKILVDNPDLPKGQQSEYLDIIEKESDRVARLVNQVLDLEKLQRSKANIVLRPVDFGEIVAQAVRGVQPLAEQKSVKLKTTLPDEKLKVAGSTDQLTQMVVNLLSNAIKFSPENSGAVDVKLASQGQSVLLSVSDNGTGIADEDKQHIFEPFSQVSHQDFGKPKGTGLGLAITHELVQQHDGEIWVESEVGEGAVFFIRLPSSKE